MYRVRYCMRKKQERRGTTGEGEKRQVEEQERPANTDAHSLVLAGTNSHATTRSRRVLHASKEAPTH